MLDEACSDLDEISLEADEGESNALDDVVATDGFELDVTG